MALQGEEKSITMRLKVDPQQYKRDHGSSIGVKRVAGSTSKMTVKDREEAFRILGGDRTLEYAVKIGCSVPQSIRRTLKLVPGFMAKFNFRVPLEALDLYEKKRLKDKAVIEQWRQSERTPSPDPIPPRDAMTNEQRRAALNCGY